MESRLREGAPPVAKRMPRLFDADAGRPAALDLQQWAEEPDFGSCLSRMGRGARLRLLLIKNGQRSQTSALAYLEGRYDDRESAARRLDDFGRRGACKPARRVHR